MIKNMLLCMGILVTPVVSPELAQGFDIPRFDDRVDDPFSNPGFIGYVCTATDDRDVFARYTFRGFGTHRWEAERQALRECERAMVTHGACRIVSCRRQVPEPWDGTPPDFGDEPFGELE